jgi:hypothetical protein
MGDARDQLVDQVRGVAQQAKETLEEKMTEGGPSSRR